MRASLPFPRFPTAAAIVSLLALVASCAGEDANTGEAELTSSALTCPSGTHVCGNSCVTNNSPLHCGQSCTPCPVPQNGVAACSNGSCQALCAAGYKLCNNACIPVGSICGTTTCAAGFHFCGGMCVSDTNVNSCGTSCSTCPAPANGSATCNGSTCGFSCAAGFHACGGRCLSNTSVNSCGTSCTACPAPANGSATCNGSTCGFSCAAGFKACNGACVPVSTTCGIITCPAGFHHCGGVCVSNLSVTSCGTSCTACPAPANGAATCNGTVCGVTCAAGFKVCRQSCIPSSSSC